MLYLSADSSRNENNKNLWVLVFICVINSLGFGIIVPLIYPYGKQFGITEQTLGLLTASFSIAQFFATPILGSLSDKYGRKPILIISLIGTCISFILFAQARSLIMLFAARILDGITGGNISVAQAMVSDTSTPEDRAKNFGIIGSAFGFGFVIGPAIGGVLSKISLQAPFYFSAGIALIGVLCCYFFLQETNPEHKRKNDSEFSFKSLITVLKHPIVGSAVFIGFLLTMAQFTMIIGFQTFTADVLKITPFQIGVFFAGFGISGILMQLAVPYINKIISSKTLILLLSLIFCFAAMLLSGFTTQLIFFAGCMCVYGLFNGLRNPMLNAIISERVTEHEQGQTLGINQSYAFHRANFWSDRCWINFRLFNTLRFLFIRIFHFSRIFIYFNFKIKRKKQSITMLKFNLREIVSVTMILFAIIDIIGTIPIIIDMRQKAGKIESEKASLTVLVLMVIFLFVGDQLLAIINIDVASFAIAGSLVIFVIAVELILGIRLFKEEEISSTASIVPLAFPLIAGAGTMTTLLSLKSEYQTQNILVGITLNTIFVYLVLKNVQVLEKLLGKTGLSVLRKAFGIILLAISIKLFRSNTHL